MILYYIDLSPPCRAVMLTAKHLGIELKKQVVNLLNKDHLKPEFLEMNPLHCVPTLVDGDLTIWESRAICAYLASQYGKDDLLYPKEPLQRAKVDMLLYFDMGNLSSQYGEYIGPVIYDGLKEPVHSKLARLLESLAWFNDSLKGIRFATGNSITIADHCLIATISSLKEAGIDLVDYPYILKWMDTCEIEMPGYESENLKGAKEFGNFVQQRLSS